MIDRMPEVGRDAHAVEIAWARSLRHGLEVALTGLKAAQELNGLLGVITSERANEQGRWEVDVRHGGELRRLSLRPANLQRAKTREAPVAAAAPTAAAPAAGGPTPAPPRAAPPAKFNGLSALVAAERPGGEVEFCKTFAVRFSNLEVVGQPAERQQRGRTQRSQQPPNSARPDCLRRGSVVRLHSWENEWARFNGLLGTVRSTTAGADGRWQVEVAKSFAMSSGRIDARPGASGLDLGHSSAQAGCSELLRLDATVVLHGLRAKAEYNGEWGALVSAGPNEDGRWEVEVLYNGEVRRLLLKSDNIAPEVAA